MPFLPIWHASAGHTRCHAGGFARNPGCAPAYTSLHPPSTTDMWDPYVRVIFNLEHLHGRCFYVQPSPISWRRRALPWSACPYPVAALPRAGRHTLPMAGTPISSGRPPHDRSARPPMATAPISREAVGGRTAPNPWPDDPQYMAGVPPRGRHVAPFPWRSSPPELVDSRVSFRPSARNRSTPVRSAAIWRCPSSSSGCCWWWLVSSAADAAPIRVARLSSAVPKVWFQCRTSQESKAIMAGVGAKEKLKGGRRLQGYFGHFTFQSMLARAD
jgi:hypothetical protein